MKSPLYRIRRGALVLLAIVVVSTIGYRFLGDFDWVDALWMVVITISTVGYSEESSLSSSVQLFTIFVIVFGMSASVYTFGGMIQFIFEGELDQLLGKRRMEQELAKLNQHVIICGYGRMGQNLASELDTTKHPFVVIDEDPQLFEDGAVAGKLATSIANTHVVPHQAQTTAHLSAKPINIVGDATQESVLTAAGVATAKTLVTALPSDAENVFITLTARNLNPNLQIIARAEQTTTAGKLRQAGASRIVMPTVVGARQMARMITRPSTAELIDLVSERGFEEFELDEIFIPESCSLVGMTVGDTQANLKYKLLVVAVQQPSGEMHFNPDGTLPFEAGQTLIVMGDCKDISRFCEAFGIV